MACSRQRRYERRITAAASPACRAGALVASPPGSGSLAITLISPGLQPGRIGSIRCAPRIGVRLSPPFRGGPAGTKSPFEILERFRQVEEPMGEVAPSHRLDAASRSRGRRTIMARGAELDVFDIQLVTEPTKVRAGRDELATAETG
jgi:hypothetical protein